MPFALPPIVLVTVVAASAERLGHGCSGQCEWSRGEVE